MSAPASTEVRVAELVATLSLGTDLGLGQPMEHIIRTTLLSLRLADRLELDDEERAEVYYTGLLAWVGCHTDAYEQAKWFGDDLTAKAAGYDYDMGRLTSQLAYMVRSVGQGQSLLDRARLFAQLPRAARRNQLVDLHNHWQAADGLAQRLGLGQELRQSLSQSFERWDGKGLAGLAQEEIRLPSRVVALADVLTVFHDARGPEAAVEVAQERRGTQFDPGLVDLFCAEPDELLVHADRGSSWRDVLEAEPALARSTLSGAALDDALEAVADFADLKSPYTIGHSRSVADLAASAAEGFGLAEERRVALRRAGLLHDLGRLGVSNAIWDKPSPLTTSEAERVRLHPYLTERMLAATPGLAPLAAIAVQHHERLDGSGYPRGLSGSSITEEGRLLAAADAYAARTEPRPHREALSPDDTAKHLRDEVRAGRLDGDAVEAVLGAAGHRAQRRRVLPAGLTARETEVLCLLARGLTNREIAEALSITAKTAGSHVEHIYAKTGARNRAGASIFASQHGLMRD
ncbi:MAG TPA: HD domain-containing phosphohydrolase [Nocardioidaceae bacterium]|nr:HD domain-containing phosphohydrolase [Nocardioidaceae bacterium]